MYKEREKETKKMFCKRSSINKAKEEWKEGGREERRKWEREGGEEVYRNGQTEREANERG